MIADMKRVVVLVAVVGLGAACSSERSSNAATTTTPTTASSAATTTVATTPPTTTTPSTTASQSTTTTACPPVGDVAPKASSDPLALSSMIGVDIRTGRHPCFERIVIELGAAGDFPGWTVEYVDDPVPLGQSDERVDIAGSATLSIRMGMWMPTMEGGGYVGPIQLFPDNVSHILELRKTENSEGMSIWSVGLDAEYPFTVDVLSGPPRLVIDVQVATSG